MGIFFDIIGDVNIKAFTILEGKTLKKMRKNYDRLLGIFVHISCVF